MKICALEECKKSFQPRTHNQKFHAAECCRIATNRRLMQKYHERQAQKRGDVRYCQDCQTTTLSRYNDTKICSACKKKKKTEQNNSFSNMMKNTLIEVA